MRVAAQAVIASVCLVTSSACGLFAGAVSNATAQDISADLFPPAELGGEPVQQLQFQAIASDGTPTYGLPEGADTTAWGPVIYAHIRALDSGDAEGVFEVQVASFAQETAQNLLFTIDVSSRDGRVFAMEGLSGDANPTTCSFVVAAGSNGATLGSRITTCLVDWVRGNGIPAQLHYTVGVTTTSQPGQQISGIPFAHQHTETLVAKRQLEQECFERNLSLSSGILDNIDYVQLKNLSVEGSATVSVDVQVQAWAQVLPSIPLTPGTSVQMNAAVPANTPRSYRYDGSRETANDFNAQFIPAMGGWMYQTLDLAIEGAVLAREGSPHKAVVGCYTVYGDAPRTGTITFKIKGEAAFSTEAQ